ncbi:MAG TPA: DUF4279 domain-containing protein [Thermomicrobiales bacterium]|nr:DUF4279 domain-containing protein [Thermomicrobiales bacterium]
MESYRLDYQERPTTVVKFWLKGDDLQPRAITRTLGVQPADSWAKGETIVRQGKIFPAQRKFGAWCLAPITSKYEPFEAQLSQLLERLESLPPALADWVRRFDGFISVGYSSGEGSFGFCIDHSSMQRLCRLGLEIDFDIYPVRAANSDRDTIQSEE